jgi:hypothetical protein
VSGISSARKARYNKLILRLRDGGVWTKLDGLYVPAAEAAVASLANLKSASFTATLTNAPTFAVDRGYTGNGSSSFVDCNFNPTTASSPNYIKDSNSGFFWSNTSADNSAEEMGQASGAGLSLYARAFGVCITRNNSNAGAFTSVANSDGKCFITGTRTGANLQTGYKDGLSYGTETGASTDLTNANITFCAGSGEFSAKQVMVAGFGAGLTATEVALLYDALREYLTGISAI